MIENQNAEQIEEEQVSIQVTEDPVEASGAANDGDELENYTKSVSKRINKMNAKTRAAEERAQMAEQIAQQREAEIPALRNHSQIQAGTVLQKEEEAIAAKEQQADDLYKKAVQSGDADLMSKADTLKSDLSIQKEKHRLAKNRQDQQLAQYQQQIQSQPVQQQAQPIVEPTNEALSWYENNKWYGDAEDQGNLEATQYAYFQHYNLINEGHEPDSDEYYEELNNKKNGVTFSKSEVERLRGLKPHNMSEEAWLKKVAAEKQRIASREAM